MSHQSQMPAELFGNLVLRADRMCLIAERPMRAAILVNRLEQVVVILRIKRLVGHLRVVAGAREVAVE